LIYFLFVDQKIYWVRRFWK